MQNFLNHLKVPENGFVNHESSCGFLIIIFKNDESFWLFDFFLQSELEKQIRQKIEMQTTHAQQMHFKALRQEAEREEEEAFKKQVWTLPHYVLQLIYLSSHTQEVMFCILL